MAARMQLKAEYAAKIAWGKPDSPRSSLCSLCFAKIGGDDVPLMLWRHDGAGAQFCDPCAAKLFELKNGHN